MICLTFCPSFHIIGKVGIEARGAFAVTEEIALGSQLVAYDGLDAYIRKINSYPMLTATEETSLAEALQKTGDQQAAYKLVMSHMRFVVRIARGYMGYGLQLKDLIQEGSIGLMQAVKRFKPENGVRLATYAIHWIKSEIHDFVIKNWKLVKIATTKAQRKLFFNLRKFKHDSKWLSDSDVKMVACELGVSEREVTEMEARMAAPDMSYDTTEIVEEDPTLRLPLLCLEDKNSNFSVKMETTDWQDSAQESLAEALSQLDERARYIVQRRWLDENKATLQELAERFGVSAERVRQLEKQALATLKRIIMKISEEE